MNTPPGSGTPPELWTPKTILDWCEPYFRKHQIPSPRLDAELLLSHVLNCRRIDLYLQFDRPLDSDELERFRGLVRARAAREPVAYLTGEAGFWGLTLHIQPGCLVPRPETETLVEQALAVISELREDPAEPFRIVEMGSGSGAIPLALCADAQNLWVVATEKSREAMAVAATNRGRHAGKIAEGKNRIDLILADGLEPLLPAFQPRLILSNPPYIPSDVIPTLEPEVARFEPKMALDGGQDGLDPHRYLMEKAAVCLSQGGRLLMEIGYDQGEGVRKLAEAHSRLKLIGIEKDLGGRDRIAHFEKA